MIQETIDPCNVISNILNNSDKHLSQLHLATVSCVNAHGYELCKSLDQEEKSFEKEMSQLKQLLPILGCISKHAIVKVEILKNGFQDSLLRSSYLSKIESTNLNFIKKYSSNTDFLQGANDKLINKNKIIDKPHKEVFKDFGSYTYEMINALIDHHSYASIGNDKEYVAAFDTHELKMQDVLINSYESIYGESSEYIDY